MPYGRVGEFTDKTIKPNDFWPELALADFQEDYKFPADFALDTVELMIRKSIFEVLKELNPKVIEWKDSGFTSIEQVPEQEILLDTYELVAHFQHAVFSLAKAKLFAQLEGMTRRDTRESLSDEAQKNMDYWQAESKKAIRAILGKPAISVELL